MRDAYGSGIADVGIGDPSPTGSIRRALAIACGIAILGAIAPCSSVEAGDAVELRDETASAIVTLRQPLLISERYPIVVPFARFWIAEPLPHLQAIRGLAERPSAAAIPDLIVLLRDRHFPYRAEVAAVLGLMPDPSAALPLLESFSDPDANTRRVAASATGSFLQQDVMDSDTRSRAISSLQELLRSDPDSLVRHASYKALLQYGGSAAFLPTLGLAADNSHFLLRCVYTTDRAGLATFSGSEQVRKDAVEMLRTALDDKGPRLLRLGLPRAFYRSRYPCASVREEAARGLGLLKDNGAVARLVQEVTNNPDAAFRAAAAGALGRVGGAESVAGLLAGLKDACPEVRRRVMSALVETGDPAAGDRLAEILTHGDSYDRLSAALSMQNVDGHYDSLAQALGDGNVQTRRAAEAALLSHENTESVEVLAETLSGASERCRVGAALVLGRYTGEKSRQRLVDILRNGQEREATLAALALGLRGEDSSRVELESALFEGDSRDPIALIHALQDLGRPAALPALRTYLESPLDPEVRAVGDLAVTVLERLEAESNL